MSLAINHYYDRKYKEKKVKNEAECYTLGMLSSERDRRLKKRGF